MDAEGAANSCQLLVTNLQQTEILERGPAFKWIVALIREFMLRTDHESEGQVKAVFPFGVNTQGCRYKVILEDFPSHVLDQTIIPGFEAHQCAVKKVDADRNVEDKKRSHERMLDIRSRVKSIGAVDRMESLIKDLKDMRGNGGKVAKKEQFAEDAMSVLKTSVKVGAANLEEAKDT